MQLFKFEAGYLFEMVTGQLFYKEAGQLFDDGRWTIN